MAPVIDVHAHVFNARDIPIFGYLRSRKSESPVENLLSWILRRPLAACLDTNPDQRRWGCNIMLELLSAGMGAHALL